MTEVEKPQAHRKCACSRNRQCAMHRDQMRPLTRKIEAERKAERQQQKVAEGIEALRARYGGRR